MSELVLSTTQRISSYSTPPVIVGAYGCVVISPHIPDSLSEKKKTNIKKRTQDNNKHKKDKKKKKNLKLRDQEKSKTKEIKNKNNKKKK